MFLDIFNVVLFLASFAFTIALLVRRHRDQAELQRIVVDLVDGRWTNQEARDLLIKHANLGTEEDVRRYHLGF